MDNNNIWAEIQDYMKSNITPTAYHLWISAIELTCLDDTSAKLNVPKELNLNIIKAKYSNLFENAFKNALGHKIAVEFTCNDISNETDNKEDNISLGELSDIGKLSNLEIAIIKKFRTISENDRERVLTDLENNTLNENDSPNLNEFTFDNFVVGDSYLRASHSISGRARTPPLYRRYPPA